MRYYEGTKEKRGALFVNLFGGPGAGKTVMAARMFAGLKMMGVEAMNPEEHAKLAILSGRPWLLDEQIIMAGKTMETMFNLKDKASVIIMDSPILLCSVYGKREPPAFHSLIEDVHKRFNHVNIMVIRDEKAGYDPSNRREDQEQALLIDHLLTNKIESIGEDFLSVRRGQDINEILISLSPS